VAPEANSAEVASIATLVAKLEEIRQGLTQSLRVLHEKMKTLETEQPSLLDEVARFKKTSETRASVLEAEVNELREELRSLREFLGASEERV
jgi:predicted  nucleic acid-binding Zn-ribbon protein